MLKKVSEYIRRNALLHTGQRYIIALSGGADSMALLRAMATLGYDVEAAHCNFHLRGDESVRDEEFVKSQCNALNVNLHLAHFDTLTYAQTHHISIEMAARELRYHYFAQLRRDIEAEAVCVAHHRDDSIETLLLNLLRGTGIHGLTGIKSRCASQYDKTCTIVRPLLCVSRKEIEQWLDSIGQTYVTDSTNLQDDVMRNKIRLNLLPQLCQIQPSALQNLQVTMELMNETEHIYNAYTHEFLEKAVKHSELQSDAPTAYIEIETLKTSASPLSVLFEWLTSYHFNPATIRQINEGLSAQTGHYWQSETHELYLDRGRLLLTQKQAVFTPLRMPETGLYTAQDGLRVRVSKKTGAVIIKEPNVACLDAASIRFPLTLRMVQTGDRFTPFGMKGSKLVSDFLTDMKMPLPEKKRQLLLTDANGMILWLAGLRPSALHSISTSTTETLLVEIISKKAECLK